MNPRMYFMLFNLTGGQRRKPFPINPVRCTGKKNISISILRDRLLLFLAGNDKYFRLESGQPADARDLQLVAPFHEVSLIKDG